MLLSAAMLVTSVVVFAGSANNGPQVSTSELFAASTYSSLLDLYVGTNPVRVVQEGKVANVEVLALKATCTTGPNPSCASTYCECSCSGGTADPDCVCTCGAPPGGPCLNQPPG
jgi:hypothetical protein